MMRRSPGYILVEAVTAMALLSIGSVAIQGALRQAILVRGQAIDYTKARFLLDQLIAETELQPQLIEVSKSGNFDGENSRFHWKLQVRKVNLPEPEIPPQFQNQFRDVKLTVRFLTRISATVSWERAGQPFKESFETLWLSEKLYVPDEREIQNGIRRQRGY